MITGREAWAAITVVKEVVQEGSYFSRRAELYDALKLLMDYAKQVKDALALEGVFTADGGPSLDEIEQEVQSLQAGLATADAAAGTYGADESHASIEAGIDPVTVISLVSLILRLIAEWRKG